MRVKLLFGMASALLLPLCMNGQTEKDIKLTKALNDIKFHDYAEMYLTRRIRNNPPNVDRLKILLAETYIAWNKRDEAMKIIHQFKPGSQYYVYAQGAVGVAAASKRDFANAVKSLEQVLNYCKSRKSDDEKKAAVKDFANALKYLQYIYKETGNIKRLAEVSNMIALDQNPREAAFFRIMAELDTAQSLKVNEKPADRAKFRGKRTLRLDAFRKRHDLKTMRSSQNARKQLELVTKTDFKDWQSITMKAVFDLEEVQWGGQDVVTAFANGGIVRALTMLDDIPSALRTAQKAEELATACNEAFKKEGKIQESPGGLLMYWKAVAFHRNFSLAKDPKTKAKSLREAFRTFGRYLIMFEGASETPKAYSEFLTVCDELSKLQPKLTAQIAAQKKRVPAPGISDEKIVSGELEQLFKNKRWSDAEKAAMPLIFKHRVSPSLPEAIHILAVSLARQEKDLEALAWCGLLADQYPRHPASATTFLQVAEVLWSSKKPSRRNDALFVYEYFLKHTPDHQFGGDIAMRVANEYYNRAIQTGEAANKMHGQEKAVAIDRAIDMFKRSIPHYSRVVMKYGNRRELSDIAYFNMAAAQAQANRSDEAAKTYLLFCESNPQDLVRLSSAKMNAASSFFAAGEYNNKVARELREKAFGMPIKKNEDANSEGSRAYLLVKADKLEEEAKNFYREGIRNANEYIGRWFHTELARVRNNAKVKKDLEEVERVLPWLYDSSGNKQEATNNFKKFIAKYPRNKHVPTSMMRLGVIYTETGKDGEAEKVLETLSQKFPDTEAGKNAKFYLARSLYNNGNFDKCVDIINGIYRSPTLKKNLTVSNLRWISSNLYNCGGKHPVKAAKVALTAAEELLAMLKKQPQGKDLESWVGPLRSAQMNANKKDYEQTTTLLKEKILSDAASAAFWTGDSANAVKYCDQLLARDTQTPYFYTGKFLRADALVKLAKYDEAIQDLAAASLSANTTNKQSLYNKAQCLMGDINLNNKDNKLKAFSAYNIIAATAYNGDDEEFLASAKTTDERKALRKELEDSKEWLERAIYGAAYTASLLDKQEDKAKMVQKYKKNFPKGRFLKEIDKLPLPAAK